MRKQGVKAGIFFILCLSLIAGIEAQTGPGQYSEEAPLGSWNLFGLETAASLGAGFCQLTRATSSAVIYSNPALLTRLPPTTLSLSLSFNQTQLFRYWLVNTGVITTRGNLTWRGWQIDHLGVSYRFGNWTIGLGAALTENYGRPGIDYRYTYNNVIYRQLSLYQTGYLNSYSFGLGIELTENLSLGISLIYNRGRIERHLEETWPQDRIKLADNRQQTISGFNPLIGMYYNLSNRLSLGLSLSPSHHRKIEGNSSLLYTSPETEIEIRGEASDRAKRPPVIGLGGRFSLSPWVEVYMEAVYFGWNHYSFYYYGEEQPREFRSAVRLGTGLEYRSQLHLMGRTWTAPYYLGFGLDPQPNPDFKSTYYYLTFGSGLGNEILSLSFSAALGIESGTGHHLKRHRILITFDFSPDIKQNSQGKAK